MSEAWVFAYGSLVHPASAAETLGPAPDRPAVAAALSGWRRGFTQARDNLACEKTFALADGSIPGFVLGLNVHPCAGEEVRGVAIAVTAGEVERLDARELRYDRVEVTADVSGAGALDAPVYTYVAKREHLALEPPPGAVILRSYLDAVESAFAALGEEELEAFRRSVSPHPAPVVAARLTRDEIPPGNPRAW
jgi:cation transport regulator ChaC